MKAPIIQDLIGLYNECAIWISETLTSLYTYFGLELISENFLVLAGCIVALMLWPNI